MTDEQKGQEFREIGKKIRENPERMVLSRVPVPTQNRLKEIAQEEFSGDYGMALKGLIDLRDVYEQSLSRLDLLESEVVQLHRAVSIAITQGGEGGEQVKKLLSGKEIKVNKK